METPREATETPRGAKEATIILDLVSVALLSRPSSCTVRNFAQARPIMPSILLVGASASEPLHCGCQWKSCTNVHMYMRTYVRPRPTARLCMRERCWNSAELAGFKQISWFCSCLFWFKICPKYSKKATVRQDWNDAGNRTAPSVLEKRQSQPPLVCVALLSLYSLLVAVTSVTSLTLAP